MIGRIYIIKNDLNDKVYIGSTKEPISRRFSKHKYDMKRKHSKLYKAFEQLGIDCFYIEQLEEIEVEDMAQLRSIECEYIMHYDTKHNGYNTRLS